MGSKGSQTTTTTTRPPKEVMAAYNDVVGRAQNVASQPYEAYTGQLVAPVNAQQTGAYDTFQGILQQATDYANQGAGTISAADIAAYQNPYQQQVIDATRANLEANNVQQRQALTGNAIARGAFGGSREAIAQAELARQQKLADDATIGNLYSQGYSQALAAAQADRSRQAQAAGTFANLGQLGYNAQLGQGLLQQQTEQAGLDAAYQQWLNKQQYPFQTTEFLSNVVGSLAPSMGGTSSTTQPGPSPLSQIAGLGLAGLGIFGLPTFGAGAIMGGISPFFRDGGRVPYADGGSIPYQREEGTGVVPRTQMRPAGMGLPQPPQATREPSVMEMVQQAVPAIRSMRKDQGKQPIDIRSAGLGNLADALKGMFVRPGPFFADGGAVDDLEDDGSGVFGPRGYAAGGYLGLGDLPYAPAPILFSGIPEAADPQPALGGVIAVAPKAGKPAGSADGFGDIFTRTESQYGLPAGYLNRVAAIESNFNPAARNPSGASGLFQFMPGTARQYGLGDPFDALASTDAAARLANDNRNVLVKALGREPTAGELYLAHQQGAGGASRLLSNPNAPAADIVGQKAVLQNGGNLNMTAAEFARKWISRVDGAEPGAPPTFEARPTTGEMATRPPPVAQEADDGRLPEDVRMALIAAGLGMLAGQSPNAGQNIGQGALAGLQYLTDYRRGQREDEREARKDELAERQFSLDTRRVDLAAQQLAQEAELARQRLAAESAPPGQFTPLVTPQDRAAAGIAPADTGVYQRGPDGKVYAVGTGGTNLSVNLGPNGIDYGEPEKGLVWARNPDGSVKLDDRGAPVAIPYQGGPEWSRLERVASGTESRADQAGLVVQDINRALNLIDNSDFPTTGFGSLASAVPGTPAHDLGQLLNTISANISFDTLQEMRNNSPTGGALGPVSDREGQLLAAAKGAVSQSQSAQQLKDNLARLNNLYLDIIHGPGNGPARMPLSFEPAADPAFPGAPPVGTIEDGYEYKGGDPSMPASWEPVS